jgi:hypothetical protein
LIRRAVILSTALFASAAFAKAHGRADGLIRYTPAPDESERPLPTEIFAAPQGSDYALRVEFDKFPWGDGCKMRCADATIFLDTDDNKATGLDLGPQSKETGADLAITIMGQRQYRAHSAEAFLKVRVRRLVNVASVGQGDVIAELDHRHDQDRLQSDGTRVYARIDATDATLPSGRKMRVVYHPPGESALQTVTAGMLSHPSGRAVQVFRRGVEVKPHHKKKTRD